MNEKQADEMTQKAIGPVQYSIATHAAEKITPGREAIRLCEKIADGQISGNEAAERIKRSCGIERRLTQG